MWSDEGLIHLAEGFEWQISREMFYDANMFVRLLDFFVDMFGEGQVRGKNESKVFLLRFGRNFDTVEEDGWVVRFFLFAGKYHFRGCTAENSVFALVEDIPK